MTLVIPVVAFLLDPAVLHPRPGHHRRRQVTATRPDRAVPGRADVRRRAPDRPATAGRDRDAARAARRPRGAGDVLHPGPLGRGVSRDGARRSRRPAISSATTPTTMPGCRCSPMPASPRTWREAGRVIRETTGVDPRPWFRCPFGAGADDPRVLAAVRAAGYRHVGWHVGVEDWDPANVGGDASSATWSTATLAHGDGAVVLLHAWPTRDPRRRSRAIAGRLRDAGATFVTIDALGEVPSTVDVSPARPPEVAVLAVDGGNSKTDLLLVGPDGRLLASRPRADELAPEGRDGRRGGPPRRAGGRCLGAGGLDADARPPAADRRRTRSPAPTRRPTSAGSAAAFGARRPGRDALIVNDAIAPAPRRLRAAAGASASSAARASTRRGSARTGGRARLAALGADLGRLGWRRGDRLGRARGRGPRPRRPRPADRAGADACPRSSACAGRST